MELLFKYPPLSKTFAVPYNQPTLSGNKEVIFGVLINNEKCLQLMIDFLAKLIGSSNPSSFSDKELEILQLITKKLELEQDEEESEVENPRLEQSSSSGSKIKDSQRLSQEERQLLISSIEFVISGEIINEKKEQHPISELNIVKNSLIIIVRFNFRRGFDSKNKKPIQYQPKMKEIPEFFKCKEHENEKCNHYCKTCHKLICAFDLVPNSKQKPEESCKNHGVVTLQEHQIEKQDEIVKQKQDLEKKIQEIAEKNKDLEFEELIAKKEKNLKSNQLIYDKLKEIDEILFENNECLNEVDYCQLEKMMELSLKSKEIIDRTIVEKNDKLEELSKQVMLLKTTISTLNGEIDSLTIRNNELDYQYRKLDRDYSHLQQDWYRISNKNK